MAHTARRPPCPQCARRRRRLRAHSPFLNALCMPVSRWGFTLCAIAALYAGLTAYAVFAGAVATAAWRYN
jgi:hypothetical protein